jgi:AcrR family transcriptional regulator
LQLARAKDPPQKILQVASRLFAERGYSNVSIRDVCKAAQTTAPMIYYYFGSKKGLFNAVVKNFVSMKGFVDKLRTSTEGKESREGIAVFIGIYLSSFPDAAFNTGLYIRDSAKLDSESAKRINEDLDEIQRIAADIVERGIKQNQFRRTDPSRAADCLIGMLNRVVFQRIHFERPANLESSKAFIADFFIRAMQTS